MLKVTHLSGFGSSVDPAEVIEWVDSFSIALTGGNSAGWSGYTLRQVIPASLLSESGSLVRLHLHASSFSGFTIDALYIGEQAAAGDAYDMKASAPAPTQLLVSGSGTIVASWDEIIITDALAFAIDETKTYIVSMHFSAASEFRYVNGVAGASAYNKAAVNEASTADVTGYSAIASNPVRLITKLQVAP